MGRKMTFLTPITVLLPRINPLVHWYSMNYDEYYLA